MIDWKHVVLQKQLPLTFFKKVVHKNFAIFTGKHLCWSLFFIKLQAFRLVTSLKRDSSKGVLPMQNSWETPILKNTCVWLLLNWLYKMVVWNFVSGQSLSKPSWRSNMTKIPVAFKPDFKYNLLHMRSLYLTLTLSFEPRFFMFIINGNYTKSKRL